MNSVIAHIDISTPTGRRILKELEKHTKTVRVEYPTEDYDFNKKTYSIEESFGKVEEKLNQHYGTDIRLKLSK